MADNGNGKVLVALAVGAGMLLAVSLTGSDAPPKPSYAREEDSFIQAQPSLTELPVFSVQVGAKNANRRASVAGPSQSVTASNSGETVKHKKSGEERSRIASATSGHLLFRNLLDVQREEIFDAMFEIKVKAGDAVIKQGDDGDYFYVVDSGNLNVLVNGKQVHQYRDGGCFGELALLYNQPRAASVIASTECVLWRVDGATFQRIVTTSNREKRQLHEKFLEKVSLLASLSEGERAKAADALEPVTFQAGEKILMEGEFGDRFFIVEEGTAIVKKNGEEVNRLQSGQYFGEIALLTDGYRAASVEALDRLQCLALDKESFTRLLGPCTDILKRNMSNYEAFKTVLDKK